MSSATRFSTLSPIRPETMSGRSSQGIVVPPSAAQSRLIQIAKETSYPFGSVSPSAKVSISRTAEITALLAGNTSNGTNSRPNFFPPDSTAPSVSDSVDPELTSGADEATNPSCMTRRNAALSSFSQSRSAAPTRTGQIHPPRGLDPTILHQEERSVADALLWPGHEDDL
ncbi:hypothetical protein IAU60_003653 [Kwoniella sp. DSM 27419]